MKGRDMKSKVYIALLMCIMALCAYSCKKDTDPNTASFKIVKETEKIVVGTTEATISGTYEYPGTINSIKVRVGTSEQLFGSNVYVTEVSGKAYSVNITGLCSGTKYYYRYEVNYGAKDDYLTETDSFTTQSESPTVKTLEVQAIDSTTFRVKCVVDADGGSEVTERGICFNTYGDPTLDDETMQHASGGVGQYTLRIEGLALSTKYYVCAYAKNASGIGFGEVLEFETLAEARLPEVSTVEVSNVTSTTATCMGNVASDGGLELTDRGVCWSLSANPTMIDSHAVAMDATLGVFEVAMTGLTPNKTYHVRAYATNAKGTAYGNDLTFTTTEGLPVVTTSGITEISATSAKGGGDVTDQGASTVTERGICWGTSHNPTTAGIHASNGTGAGSYTVSMTNLTPNATYYVRAYATNSQGTSYGSEVSFTTLSSGGNAPQGAINGKFTINANGDKVYFSQGNLQYKASNNTWRFATNQYEYIGDANSNISSSYSGWIDLFGWGTSGNNHGAVCYQPWSTSQTNSDYYAYGQSTYNLYDQTGQADWGYNAISNGGNQANQWRTLTRNEWAYVFNNRTTSSGIRYAKANVNNVNGVILLPDDWSTSYYSLSNTNQGTASYSSNVISSTQWSTLEQHGAVFLPAAGNRLGASLLEVGSGGYYWSASYYDGDSAYVVVFDDSILVPQASNYRYYGQSVRLVRSAQ